MRWLMWTLALVACSGSTVGSETGVTPSDDTDTDEPIPTPVETECDDTLDDDGDSLIDCDDPDCAAEVFCAWPSELDWETNIDFDASTLAEIAGYSDCSIVATSTLSRDREQTCVGCDRVLCGVFTYTTDTCPQDSALPRPADGCFGITFDDTDMSWEFQVPDAEGAFQVVGAATGDGSGHLSLTVSDPLEVEGFDAGTVTTFVGFTRP